MTKTPWLELAIADIGKKEVKGAKDNPDVLACFADCGHPEIEHDETAWCAAQMGSWLVRSGYAIPPKSSNLMARSYLNYGKKLDLPVPGAIAVWARGKPPFGHVNVVAKVNKDGTVTCIGGNQSDSVSYAKGKISDALAFRWPVMAAEINAKTLRAAGSKTIANADLIKAGGIAGGAISAVTGAAKETGVTDVAPVIPPDPMEALRKLTETTDLSTAALNSFKGFLELALTNMWVLGIALGIGGYVLSKHIINRRVSDARLGLNIGRLFD